MNQPRGKRAQVGNLPRDYRTIFVFGSNLKGIHGAGAALHAKRHWGAIPGRGEGLMNDCYAIPTCKEPGVKMKLDDIKPYVCDMIDCARRHPEWNFILTSIGCGLAGHQAKDIAGLFPDPSQWPPNLYVQNKLILGFMYG